MITKNCAVSMTAMAVALSATSANAEDLIVNGYGGPFESIIMTNIIEPFEEATGINVIYDAVGTSSEDFAKIKATRGNPGFDVNVMTATQSLDGCEAGLLTEFNNENTPNLEHLDEGVLKMAGPCGAVHEVQYVALMWRTDHFDTPPTSWNVLSDDALQGKIVMPGFANIMAANMLQIFATMSGNNPNDIDPGIEKMIEVAPHAIAFPNTSALMDKYLREGEAWAMPYFSGRAQLMKESGASVDFGIPDEGTVPLVSTLNIPVGAENKEAAFKFVNFWLEKASQERWVEGYKVGSIRADIEVSDEMRAQQITTSEDIQKLILPDLSVMAERLSEWGERWEREVVPAAN